MPKVEVATHRTRRIAAGFRVQSALSCVCFVTRRTERTPVWKQSPQAQPTLTPTQKPRQRHGSPRLQSRLRKQSKLFFLPLSLLLSLLLSLSQPGWLPVHHRLAAIAPSLMMMRKYLATLSPQKVNHVAGGLIGCALSIFPPQGPSHRSTGPSVPGPLTRILPGDGPHRAAKGTKRPLRRIASLVRVARHQQQPAAEKESRMRACSDATAMQGWCRIMTLMGCIFPNQPV